MFIAIETMERSTNLLENPEGQENFDTIDEACAAIKQNFMTVYKEKTGETLTNEEYEEMIGEYFDEWGIENDGQIAWINDVHGNNYDWSVLDVKTNHIQGYIKQDSLLPQR